LLIWAVGFSKPSYDRPFQKVPDAELP